MNRIRAATAWIGRHPLALCLPVQAALLFHNLALLPAWGDEQSTLAAAPGTLAKIAAWAGRDIHPPLYYFVLHWWVALPLPGPLVARARALSAVWLLLGAVAVYGLWVRKDERTGSAWWFMALWTLSPCLLLYGRMARSYSMQLCLGTLALYAGLRFLRDPNRLVWRIAGAVALAALLYTDYASGAGAALAVALVALWRTARKRDAGILRGLTAVSALTLLLYAPWLLAFGGAVRKWDARDAYTLTGNRLAEQFVKTAYWFGSFSFGETMPAAVAILALVLAPLVCWLLWQGIRNAPEWLAPAGFAVAVCFVGATRWVSFPFVPARMLFCYPFFLLLVVRGRERRPGVGQAVCAGMVLVALASLPSYFRREDFLNKGYTVPFDEIATLVNSGLSRDTLVAIDTFNTDIFPLLDRIHRTANVVLLNDAASFARVESSGAPTIWYIRNTHDTSPGGRNRKLEADLERSYTVRRFLLEPYSWLERWVIGMAGWPERPTHFYQVLELRRADAVPETGFSHLAPGDSRTRGARFSVLERASARSPDRGLKPEAARSPVTQPGSPLE